MATEMPNINGDKTKSFWERKEGWTGMIIPALLGLAFFIYSPQILALLSTTLGAIVVLGVIGAIVYMALDPTIRNIVWAAYQIFCKKVTGAIIEMDPIAIVQGYLKQLRANREVMNEQITKLRQQMGSLKRVIETNEASRVQSLKAAKVAKAKIGDTDSGVDAKAQLLLKTRAASRLENSNVNLQQLYTKLEVVYRVLKKMYENTGYVLEDTEDEVRTRIIEYEAIKTSSNAFRSAMSVINGDKDKKALFDETMEFMADNIGQRVGEMEHFMDISKSLMDGIDLQNGVFEEDGLKMLEEWENKSTTLLLSDNEKKAVIKAANDVSVDLDEDVEVEETVPLRRGRYTTSK